MRSTRLAGFIVAALTLAGCIPPPMDTADMGPELDERTQSFHDCYVRTADHFARTDNYLRDIQIAAETSCGRRRQAVADLMFEANVPRVEREQYLAEMDNAAWQNMVVLVRQYRQAN